MTKLSTKQDTFLKCTFGQSEEELVKYEEINDCFVVMLVLFVVPGINVLDTNGRVKRGFQETKPSLHVLSMSVSFCSKVSIFRYF